MLEYSAMDHAKEIEEVVQGEVDLKSFGKSITRRHADLVKATDGKAEGTFSKKGSAKNRRSIAGDMRDTPPMVS